jgi:hypothetical protein
MLERYLFCTFQKAAAQPRMIKLINLSSSPLQTYLFETVPISIGFKESEHSSSDFLCLADQNLKAVHVQIIKSQNPHQPGFLVQNLAEDPFATLNGLPFGKQPLKNGDLIQIGEATLEIHIESSLQEAALPAPTPPASPETTPLSALDLAPAEAGENKHRLKPALHMMDENKPLDLTHSLNPDELDLLMQQVEAIEGNGFPLPDPSETLGNDSRTDLAHEFSKKYEYYKSRAHPSLKEYYLHDSDEESEIHLQKAQEEPPKEQKLITWQAVAKLLAVSASIMVILLSLAYIWAEYHRKQEELLASKGVADVAMALIYTQIKHIRPQNQNWSDPEFIKNNLTAVLATEYPAFADFDKQGHFSDCPYMLRIYTNSEISRFLVLAQPAPSLLQWLLPKATLIIDSSTMEMRKVNDLKSLNRLLVNSNTLDGEHGEEIMRLVALGELVSLKNLENRKENDGFTPPKALGFIYPDAENLVYNAPRYYCLGENLIKKTEELLSQKETAHDDAALLIQEIFALKKFPLLVLYSSEGIQSALEAQKALMALAPKEKFLMAYLHMNKAGRIASSHLLMNETSPEIVSSEHAVFSTSEEQAGQLSSLIELNPAPQPEESEQDSQPVQAATKQATLGSSLKNPITAKLTEISTLRHQSLQPVNHDLILLLKKQIKNSQPDFKERFLSLQKKMFAIEERLKTEAYQKFDALSKEYLFMPAETLVHSIKEAGLENDFKEYLDETGNKKSEADIELNKREVAQELLNIQTSSNWEELEYSVERLNKLLQFDHIPAIEALIEQQQSLRTSVTSKLNEFFYSTDRPLAEVHFLKKNKERLVKILQEAWIDDLSSAESYLNEFDRRTIRVREIAD